MRIAPAVFALVLGVLPACSASSKGDPADPADAQADSSGLVGCDSPLEQAYAPNLQVKGTNGVFTFELVSSTPAPPADEDNTFVVQVLDATGQPAAGATLSSLTSTMPQMGHGTSIPTIASNGNGQFTVTLVNLFMAGLWEVTVAADDGSQKDSASFYFCVQG